MILIGSTEKKSDYSWMHREMRGQSLIPFYSTR